MVGGSFNLRQKRVRPGSYFRVEISDLQYIVEMSIHDSCQIKLVDIHNDDLKAFKTFVTNFPELNVSANIKSIITTTEAEVRR